MPDTTSYMFLGLLAVGVLTGLYSLTLVLRFRSVKQQRQLIEQYEN